MDKKSTKGFVSKEEKETKEKLKNMGFGDRLDYFVDYYKYHVVVAVLIIGAIVSLLNSYIFNPAPKTILNTVFYTGFIDTIELDQFKTRLEPAIEYDEKSEAITVSNLTRTSVDTSSEYNSEMVLVAKVSVSEIDLVIAEEEDFRYLAANSMYLPLEAYIEDGSISVSEDLFLVAENKDGSENILGIKIPDSVIEEDFEGYDIDDLYIGVVANSNFVDNGLKVLNELGN